MTHFYLTLPSNSSQQFFPDNTLTEFTTKLPSTIELTNEWEVGLAEIMFPRSWYTIPKEGLIFKVDYRGCDFETENDLKVEDAVVEVKLRGGFYKTMEEVQQELNHATSEALAETRLNLKMKPVTFYYKPLTRRMYITLMGGMSVEFPPVLESVLGLSPGQRRMCNEMDDRYTFRGDLSCDLKTGIHALYVYCDLLQYTHVGNIKAPLLRVVDSGGEAGDVVTRYYERPRYIPIQKKSFDTIQIIIRDDLGEKIQFENGKVLLTLHFRRTYNQYLI